MFAQPSCNLARSRLAAPRLSLQPDGVNPQADFKAFRDYFTKRFPKVPLNDFVNGPYSMDADLRKQWIAIEDFPPYQFALDKGKEMFETPFKNGKTYGDCFADQGHRHPPELSLFRYQVRRGRHARPRAQPVPAANGEQPLDPTSKTRWRRLPPTWHSRRAASRSTSRSPTIRGRLRPMKRRRDIFIPAAASSISPARAAMCRARASISAPRCWRRRSASRRDADLSLGMGRHGNDQPPLRDLQQPGARRAARAGGRALSRRRILSLLHEQRLADLRAGIAAMTQGQSHAPFRCDPARCALRASFRRPPRWPHSAGDFKSALAAAEAAEKTGGRAEKPMDHDRRATRGGEKGRGRKQLRCGGRSRPQQAEALAKASIAQAKEQETAWKDRSSSADPSSTPE